MSSEFRRFGDLFSEPQRNGLTRPKKVRGIGCPMVNMGELFAYSRIRDLEMDLVPVSDKEQHYFLKAGDLLFARQSLVLAGAGQCSIFLGNKADTVFESHLIRCRVDPLKYNPNFYFYFFRSPDGRKAIEAIVEQGAGASGIRGSDLVNVQVPTPPKSYQDEAAGLLVEIDDRITLLRETNATLESIAQALFKSWFVDFDPVRAKAEGRQPEGMDAATAALFPDSFEESELGLVPRGWRVATVGDVLTVTDYVANGSFAALKENVTLLDDPSYALYVRTTDYNSGFSGGFRYVDKSAYDFLSKSSLDGSEVIISNVGDVGTVFRPPKWLGLPMTLGSNAVALKNPEMSAYLYFHFSGPLGQHDIQSIVTGSAQLKFNKTNFRALRILLPDSRCLATFEEVAKSLLLRIETNLAKAQTLTHLRDTLLPRLISGQLRLPEAEALVEEACA